MIPVVFLDSDAIISSLLSSTGAAYACTQSSSIQKYISTLSYTELAVVCKRLKIEQSKLKKLVASECDVSEIPLTNESLQQRYKSFVYDPNDAHIIAGAVATKARFLITYNLKHFNAELIKREFAIIVLTPAQLLQYLRSRA